MKKIGIIAILFVSWAVNAASACELTVRVNETPYPPFFMEGENGKQTGLSIELAEALLQEAGCKPLYKPLPWKRALTYLQTGDVQVMLNMTPTEERKTFTNFIGPQLDESVVLVIRKDSNFNITSLDDFKKLPKTVGIELGRVYGDEFEQKRATDEAFAQQIEIATTMESNEKKLNTGRISGFLGYGYNIHYRIKTDPLYADFAVCPLIIRQDWVYFGFSKKGVSADMLQRLQKAYDSAEDKGVFEKIRQKYRSQ